MLDIPPQVGHRKQISGSECVLFETRLVGLVPVSLSTIIGTHSLIWTLESVEKHFSTTIQSLSAQPALEPLSNQINLTWRGVQAFTCYAAFGRVYYYSLPIKATRERLRECGAH